MSRVGAAFAGTAVAAAVLLILSGCCSQRCPYRASGEPSTFAGTAASAPGSSARPSNQAAAPMPERGAEETIVSVFSDNDIHFDPDNQDAHETGDVTSEENGRVIVRTVPIERPPGSIRITARVTTRPIPLDELSVHDRWDRAGNVRLSRPGVPDIEIVKFVTAYGGVTEHEIDVSHLAPLLEGTCTFKGFVDTWSSPGWRMDFALAFASAAADGTPAWVEALIHEASVTEEALRDGPLVTGVVVPVGIERVVMHYLVSGHCTDGRDADEFVTKYNVVYVDGREVARFKPWRDDCKQFRAINPYTRRWSDGTWSSDYSRSGWCPGDKVSPVGIDLTEHLPAGEHTLSFDIEDVRPRDENDHFGYWRVSGYLLGWIE